MATTFSLVLLAKTTFSLPAGLFTSDMYHRRRLHGGHGGDRPHGQKVVGAMPSSHRHRNFVGAMPPSRPHKNFVMSIFLKQ